LSSLYFGVNISCFLYPNKASHILKLKIKERSKTFLFEEVYIVKSVVAYLAENLYQADTIFVDWFELYSNFAAFSIKKEK
jgi:hypothetical protein